EKQELRLGIGGRAPVRACEEGCADLHLAIGWPHVEEPRGADGFARLVPDLRKDDGLTLGHEILGGADQRNRLVDSDRRRPGEVAAHLLVLHGSEEARCVALFERFERDVSTAKNRRRQVHLAPILLSLLRRQSRRSNGADSHRRGLLTGRDGGRRGARQSRSWSPWSRPRSPTGAPRP